MAGIRLEEAELFNALSPKCLERAAAGLGLRRFAAGEHLYLETQPADHLWIVRSGEVRTIKANANGRVTTLEHLRPGSIFGVAALLDEGAYPDSAQGIVAGEAWMASRRLLRDLLRDEPGMALEILGIVAVRLRSAHDRLCDFANKSVPARLARVMLDAARGDRLETTRKALGESAGTTVETAIRVLRSFEKAGWIEGGVGWVRILDREALERVSSDERSG